MSNKFADLGKARTGQPSDPAPQSSSKTKNLDWERLGRLQFRTPATLLARFKRLLQDSRAGRGKPPTQEEYLTAVLDLVCEDGDLHQRVLERVRDHRRDRVG